MLPSSTIPQFKIKCSCNWSSRNSLCKLSRIANIKSNKIRGPYLISSKFTCRWTGNRLCYISFSKINCSSNKWRMDFLRVLPMIQKGNIATEHMLEEQTTRLKVSVKQRLPNSITIELSSRDLESVGVTLVK